METYNFPRIVPQLVEDNSLKRARTTITEGGEEKEAIRVTQAGGGGLDSQGVADAMGKQASTIATRSVLNHLDNINVNTGRADNTIGTQSDPLKSYSQDGSINGRLRYISKITNDISTDGSDISTYTSAIRTATGTKSDAAWSGTGDGTVIALLKGIYNKL